MNAKALYELVKDLPRECYPEGVWYDPDGKVWNDTTDGAPASLPVLLFEASMMRWLIGEGFHSFNYVLHDHGVVLECYDKVVRTPLECGSKVQTTTLLLVAMCKAVAS